MLGRPCRAVAGRGRRGRWRRVPIGGGLRARIGEVADAAAFLVEDDGEPLPGQFGVGLDGVGDRPEGSGLAHAARADQQRVLERLGRGVVPDDINQRVEQGPAGGELRQEQVRREQRRVVKGERLKRLL